MLALYIGQFPVTCEAYLRQASLFVILNCFQAVDDADFLPHWSHRGLQFFCPRSGDRMVAIFQARLRDLEGHGIDGFEFLDQTGLDADEIFPLTRIELGNRGPRNALIFSQGGLITMSRTGMTGIGLTSVVTDWDEIKSISISNNLLSADNGVELFPFYSINKLGEDAMKIFSITDSVGSFEELLTKADLAEEAQSHGQLASADEKCALLLNDLARSLAAGCE